MVQQKLVADWQGAGSATDAAVLFATVAPATLATWTHGWTEIRKSEWKLSTVPLNLLLEVD